MSRNTSWASTASKYCYCVRISTKFLNVFFYPFQRQPLVKQSKITLGMKNDKCDLSYWLLIDNIEEMNSHFFMLINSLCSTAPRGVTKSLIGGVHSYIQLCLTDVFWNSIHFQKKSVGQNGMYEYMMCTCTKISTTDASVSWIKTNLSVAMWHICNNHKTKWPAASQRKGSINLATQPLRIFHIGFHI